MFWRVKDLTGGGSGWLLFDNEVEARKKAVETGGTLQQWDMQAIDGWLGGWITVKTGGREV